MDYFSLCFIVVLTSLFSSHSLIYGAYSATNIDKEALLHFKSLTVDHSNGLEGWDETSSHCNWTGVTCNRMNQRVVILDLRGLGLSGTISPYLSNMSFLGALHLQENQFSGKLPNEFGALSNLRILNVSNNQIQGTLTPNISRCFKLQVLDLMNNEINGKIPLELDRLTALRVLKLSQNQFNGGIPSSIGNLTSLTVLNLGTNFLNGAIPDNFGHYLPKLQQLELSLNNLTGTIPSSLYNTSSLVFFGVASNQLFGEVPQDVGDKLPNLHDYHICFNKFTGSYPRTLHNLTRIQSIRMSWNLLAGEVPRGLGNLADLLMYNIGYNRFISPPNDFGLSFIDSLTNSTRLRFLAFDGNLFEGVIPDSIGNLSADHLQRLYMGGNRIGGKIPSSIGHLLSLTLLNLSHNSIIGEIAPEISRLKGLQMLCLSNNRLSGGIPTSLGDLTNLTKLELSGNQLVGTIPTTFANFKSLLSLDLSSNMLVGSIPHEIFKLSSLSVVLNLSKNAFNGVLPREIGNLENIVTIDISQNNLFGNLPETIQNCKSLEKLLAFENSFQGRVPDSLGSVKGLEILDLSSNKFSGPIPTTLQNLNALHLLNLSFNDLEGNVPTDGVFKNLSRTYLEGNPKLCNPNSSNVCYNGVGRRKSIKTHVIILISVVFFSLLCAIGLLLFCFSSSWYKKRVNDSRSSSTSDTVLKGQHPMISYNELCKATTDFNQENLIGSGSFGTVYKGLLREGMEIAVKVINLAQVGAYKSFFAECEALRSIRHRNLVKLITSCSSTDFKGVEFLALVYKLMKNGSLDDWLRGKQRKHVEEESIGLKSLNLMDRLNIAIDVACALEYLHHECEPPVVHCDLKPSNVFLDEDMTAKVGDFGLARSLIERSNDSQYSTTSTCGLIGSIGYIPPEYGMGGKPSTNGDVYSYGVMLLELFTGMSPTHEAFTGGMTLVKWVQSTAKNNIIEILDPELQVIDLVDDEQHSTINYDYHEQFFASIVNVGLSCAVESPEARISMRDVYIKLMSLRDGLRKVAHA
ncbi:hypothetical protein Scep_012721 [Stephania cephalantha]|uniref:non-specific serine/threonine protein kinase n=1 Tax=Stephania cephalantha TaxID=152367 RepID=A0AAP0P6Y4_9MAGN